MSEPIKENVNKREDVKTRIDTMLNDAVAKHNTEHYFMRQECKECMWIHMLKNLRSFPGMFDEDYLGKEHTVDAYRRIVDGIGYGQLVSIDREKYNEDGNEWEIHNKYLAMLRELIMNFGEPVPLISKEWQEKYINAFKNLTENVKKETEKAITEPKRIHQLNFVLGAECQAKLQLQNRLMNKEYFWDIEFRNMYIKDELDKMSKLSFYVDLRCEHNIPCHEDK